MKRLFYFLLVFTATFVLSYNVCFFALEVAKARTWQEVLLRGGIVVDGSGRKPYRADLLVRGSKIAAIGEGLKPSPGARVLDVEDCLVLPGIVAVQPDILPEKQVQEKLALEGVTTLIGGTSGSAPVEIRGYLNRVVQRGLRLNFGTLLGMGSLRGMLQDPERIEQSDVETLRALVKKGLFEGFLGLSVDLKRLPDALWSWEEIEKVCYHIEPVPLLVINLPEEMCSDADVFLRELRRLKKAADKALFRPYLRNLRLPEDAPSSLLRMIQKELAQPSPRGIQICGDLNPFPLAGTPRYLLDSAVARFQPEELIIAGAPSEYRDLLGQTLSEASMKRGLTLPAMVQGLSGKGVQVEVRRAGAEANMAALPAFCWQAACADSGEGFYLKLLNSKEGRFAGLPLQEKVRRLTSLPAQLFGLRERGRIALGYCADILVLKKQGNGYTVDYVFINGKPVVIRGHLSGFRAGCLLSRD